MAMEPELTKQEIQELRKLLQNTSETPSSPEPTVPLLESNFEHWEKPQVISPIPDESQPLGQVNMEKENDGNDGEVQHFTAKGTGQGRSNHESS